MSTVTYDLNWQGTLTPQNMEHIVALMRRLLTGKKYTYVICRERNGFVPEVQTSLRLEKEIGFSANGRHGLITIIHSTKAMTLIETITNEDDPDFESAHLQFYPGKVMITQKERSRLVYLVLAVENTN